MENSFGEHSYARAWKDDGCYGSDSAMDTTPVANADDIIVNVTQLDKNHDTFESLLMELLKSHSGNTTTCNNDRGITPDSLGTLSLEQIKDIEASSPAYYETIQHVMKMKSNTELLSSPMSVDSMGLVSDISNPSLPIGSVNQSSLTNSSGSTISSISSSSKSLLDYSIKSPPQSEPSSNNPVVAVSSPSAKSPSISIKISPDQLKSLQSQITDMFKQQNLHLPDDLSAEQKQMLINSLIAQQLNATLQQWLPGVSGTTTPTSSPTQPRPQNVTATSKNQEGVATTSSTTTTKVLPSSRSSSHTTTGSRLSEKTNKDHKTDETTTKKKKESDSKRPPTAFNLFFSEMYPIVQEQQPNISFSDASKMVSGLWSGLGQDGKKKYYDKCEQIRNDFNSRSNKEIPAVRSTEVHSNLGNVNPTMNLEEQVNIKSPPPPIKSPGRKSKLTPREKEEGMCLQDGCFNMAVPEDSRGTKYCSNECVVNHSKIMFHAWISQRRVKT